jgi:hypothetical protein
MAKNGLVKNRDDIIAALQNAGFEIARKASKTISIKSPQGGQNIRLKGAIYESSFRAGADLRVELEAANRAYQGGREQRIQDFKQVYQDGSEKKRERNEKRYSRAESAPLEPVQTNKNSAIDRILAARFSSGNAVSSAPGHTNPGRNRFGQNLEQELEKNDRARATIAAITETVTERLRGAVQRTTRVLEQFSDRYRTEATKAHHRAAERAREHENMLRM